MARKDKHRGVDSQIEYPSSSGRFSEVAIPIRKRKKYYGNMLRAIGIGVIVLVVGIIALLSFLTYQNRQLTTENRSQLDESYNPSFRVRYDDIGKQVVESWFGQREPVIPYASNITWPGPQSMSDADPSRNPWADVDTDLLPSVQNVSFLHGEQSDITLDEKLAEEYPDYVDSFEETLTYYMLYNGQPMNVTVSLVAPSSVESDERPILVSTPTVEPYTEPSSYDQITSDPASEGMTPVETTDSINAALENWASAWAENDMSALKQITQDDTDKLYFGLGKWKLGENALPSINWMYERTFRNEWAGTYYIAEVEFDIQQTIVGEEDPDSDDPPEEYDYTITQTMNVLIENPESTLPVIVSWGPSGSWENLEPYSVGVDPDDSRIQQAQSNTGNEEDELLEDELIEEQPAPESDSSDDGGDGNDES